MLNRTTRLALATACYLAANWASAQTISGNGAKECGVYIQAVKLKSDVAVNGFISWAQGYLSAINAAGTHSRDIAIDPSGLSYWLTNYCGAHQNDSFFTAVQALGEELGR